MPSYRQLKRKWKQAYQANKLFIQILLILGVTSCLFLGVIYVSKILSREDITTSDRERITEEDTQFVHPDPWERTFTLTNPDQPALIQIIENTIKAYGGRDSVWALGAFQQIGQLEFATPTEVTVYIKPPGNIRISVTNMHYIYREACNGDQAWSEIERQGKASEVTMTSGTERITQIRNARMTQHPTRTILAYDRLSLNQEIEFINDRPCYSVGVKYADFHETIFIDQSNFLILGRERNDQDITGEENITRVVYSDFRYVDDVVFHFHEVVFKDKEEKNSYTIKQLFKGLVVLDTLFNPPSLFE